MSRMRSPGYPGISLEQAIDLVAKLHSKNRTNIIDRESAAKDMGYTGLTGRSLMLLGALAQFGLVGRAGKGDLKVTQTAVDILHGIEPSDRLKALREAGTAPKLFKELFERFPAGVPSDNAIRSYLIQQGFADVAIGPAIKSFLETNRFLEEATVSESHGGGGGAAPESAASTQPEIIVQTPQPIPPLTPERVDALSTALADRPLNAINMNIQGDFVHISATLNHRGLAALEKKIANLKLLMAPDDDLDDDLGLDQDTVQ